ncbi:MAG TPA: acyltransferase [Dokdonella sp.]
MSGRRNFGLDVLRSHGCIMIVVMAHGALLYYHLWSQQTALWYVGSMGMDMFFVLSGFLIGGILLDGIGTGKGWIRRFWVRRWIRTLPNYYLFFIVNVLLWRYAYGAVPEWPKFLVFAQNLAWPQSPFFPESWSLALEEVFYLIAPLVFLLFSLDPKRPRRTLIVWAVIILGGIAARWGWALTHADTWEDGVKKTVAARGDAIAWGMFAVQWVRHMRPSRERSRQLATVGAVLLAVAAVAFLANDENTSLIAKIVPFTLNGAGFALIVPWFAGLDSSRVPRWYYIATDRLAVWSYSWYVTHLVVIRLMDLVVPGRYGFALTTCKYLVYVAVSLLWARANYIYFEKPILRWRDRLVGGSDFHVLPVEKAAADAAQPSPEVARDAAV